MPDLPESTSSIISGVGDDDAGDNSGNGGIVILHQEPSSGEWFDESDGVKDELDEIIGVKDTSALGDIALDEKDLLKALPTAATTIARHSKR